MKKILFYMFFALCVSLVFISACKKTETLDAQNLPKSEFYDGDEYDKGKIVEEPEEMEEPEELDYTSDASIKIDYVSGDDYTTNGYNNSQCTTPFKFIDRFAVAENQYATSDIILFRFTDSVTVTNVVTDRTEVTVADFYKDNSASKIWDVQPNQTNPSLKTKTVKFTFTLSDGATVSKSIKMIGQYANAGVYGTSGWLVVDERIKMGKSRNVFDSEGAYQVLTSAYVPQKGDVLKFLPYSRKNAIITTDPVFKAATSTKPAGWKFKIAETNGKCNNRKYTKSMTMSDPTAILSTDGTTVATKYFRD